MLSTGDVAFAPYEVGAGDPEAAFKFGSRRVGLDERRGTTDLSSFSNLSALDFRAIDADFLVSNEDGAAGAARRHGNYAGA